jgi:hypothetical protein
MTEQEYIAATNLAKVRMAIHVVRDILPGFDGVTTDESQSKIMQALCDWQEGLQVVVKCVPNGGGL